MSNRLEDSRHLKTCGEFIAMSPIHLQSLDRKKLEIEGACVRESEDRLAAYHAGEMSAMSLDKAMQRIFG